MQDWLSEARSALQRHSVLVVAAMLAGAAALYFNYAERVGERFFLWVQGVSPWLMAVVVAGGMTLICRLRDLYFPGTEGTGIPQAMAALQLEPHERRAAISVRIALGKMLLLTIALFIGATVGREGPSVHVAACCMFLAAGYATFPRHLTERGLILAGGAAGIAAAFNAPIAGTVFAFEEIGRAFDKRNLGTIVRTVLIACIVGVIFLGNYLYYGRVRLEMPRDISAWTAVVAIGLSGGLLGGLFAAAVAWTTPRMVQLTDARPLAGPLGLGIALAVIGLASNGLSYGGGFTASQEILMNGTEYPASFSFWRAAASFVALISAIPGGLFDPSLTVGAGLGQLTQDWFPALDAKAVVLLAMVAYFAAVVQSPITAFVIMLEMTGAYGMALPLGAASILAYEVSRRVCPTSLYESLSLGFVHRMWLRYDQIR